MARIENEPIRDSFDGDSGEEEMIKEFVNEGLEGCELAHLLMDMLEMAITKQNPFNTSLNSENEDRLLGMYGYDLVELSVKDKDGHIEFHEGAIKRGDPVPKRALSHDQFSKYVKKSVLDRENQELIMRVVGWLISKFKGDVKD